MIRGDAITAVRIFFFLGVIAVSYGGVRALDYPETHQTGRLVSGLIIAAIGMAILILAAVRHRRMPPEERRPISGESKFAGVIGLVIAAVLAAFGGAAVWAMFTPNGGLKVMPIAALFFGMAALGLIAARQKFRASRQGNIQPHPGPPGAS
jgi:pimeloyl-ACP methyl ester carboxylesterase